VGQEDDRGGGGGGGGGGGRLYPLKLPNAASDKFLTTHSRGGGIEAKKTRGGGHKSEGRVKKTTRTIDRKPTSTLSTCCRSGKTPSAELKRGGGVS